MAYKTAELEKLALEAIERHCLINATEILTYMPCCEKTYYQHKIQDLQTIKKALLDSKIKTKSGLRKKWAKQKNATTEIALYKLCADKDELDILTGNSLSLGDNDKIEITFTRRES